jgi:hypothetical protein
MAKSTPCDRVEVVEDDASGRRLSARVCMAGDDLVVVVGGGTRPHVGCVVVAQPLASRSRPGALSASCSLITLPPHKEEPIARAVAERLCRASGRVVVVSAGVHEDGLEAAGIETYLRLADQLAEALVDAVVSGRGARRS